MTSVYYLVWNPAGKTIVLGKITFYFYNDFIKRFIFHEQIQFGDGGYWLHL